MNPSPAQRRLNLFARILACATAGLVFAGGLVTSKGAGLSIPDWPLAYGKALPEGWFQLENVRAELGHRLIAGTIALLTLAGAFLYAFIEPRAWIRRLAYAAVAMVLAQAILGGVTVLWRSPKPLLVFHAMLGQTFFCVTVLLALFTSGGWMAEKPPAAFPGADRIRTLALILLVSLYIQLLLGATMRHWQAGLAIIDFPLNNGHVLPQTGETALHNLNIDRDAIGLPPVNAFQVWIHFAHRAGAVLVTAAAALTIARVLRRHAHQAALLFPALTLGALIGVQLILGVLTIFSGRQPHVATTHMAVGALILANGFWLVMQAYRRTAPEGAPSAASASATREAAA